VRFAARILVSSDSPSPSPNAVRPAAPLIAVLLFVYFGAWALLRPPLQTPDEPQHLLKATSILRQPWIGPPGRFALDTRHLNPLGLDVSPGINKLYFKPFNAMSTSDIAEAKSVRWFDPQRRLPDYERAIASYPTPYYLAVFAGAEPITKALGLTPYQATYAYRLVSVALVAMLWALVWAALVRTAELSPLAGVIFAVTILNPMLTNMSSAVNPDAVNNPLCALALLLAWQFIQRGGPLLELRPLLILFVVFLIAMLTKPSGLQLVPTFGAVFAVLIAARAIRPRPAAVAFAVAALAAFVAMAVFYLWSPPRLLGAGPSQDSLGTFLTTRFADLEWLWRMYWGELGWLDYHAALGWYSLVAAMAALNLACVVLRPASCGAAGWYLGLSWLAFAAVTVAGEFWYLREAGYTFQGRYLFPAAIGLGALLCHSVPLARYGLVAAVAALNLALVHETILRYFIDRWAGLWQSLPF
jgi:hypothetical protein